MPDILIMPSAPPVAVARAQMVVSWVKGGEGFKSSKVQEFKSSKVQGLFALLHEYEIDCSDEAEECSCVIPMQAFVLEHYVGKEGEDYE